MRMMIKSCSRPTHRPPLWKHIRVLAHNQHVGASQNSLKNYPTPPTIIAWLRPSLALAHPFRSQSHHPSLHGIIHACRAFAENLEHLYGAEAEAVESLPKSRRGCGVDVQFDSRIMTGKRPFLKVVLQVSLPLQSPIPLRIPRLPICLSPHFKFYQPFIPTLIQTSLCASDNINSASSFPRNRHAMSFLHY